MNYYSGTRLAKWQWDQIFSTALINNPFESDEETMATPSTEGIQITSATTFVAPDNWKITLPAQSEVLYFCDYEQQIHNHYLYKFKTGNKTYTSQG